MKHTKKLLALLLAALLTLGLGAPAIAEGEGSIPISAVIIGPEEPVPFGEAFTLRVELDIPEGVEIESASYWWSWTNWPLPIEGAKEAMLHVTPSDSFYPVAHSPIGATETLYMCHAVLDGRDADSNAVELHTDNLFFTVTVGPEREKTVWEVIWYDYIAGPFNTGLGYAGALIFVSWGALLPFAPFIFLFGWIYALFQQLTG